MCVRARVCVCVFACVCVCVCVCLCVTYTHTHTHACTCTQHTHTHTGSEMETGRKAGMIGRMTVSMTFSRSICWAEEGSRCPHRSVCVYCLCVYVRPSVRPSVCLHVRLSVCPPVVLSVYLAVCLSANADAMRQVLEGCFRDEQEFRVLL